MVKRVCIYSLPKGTNGDEFWHWHTKIHSQDILRNSRGKCKKYVVNRVTKVVRGEELCWGFVETWWESAEAAEQVFEAWKDIKLPDGLTIAEDWWNRIIKGFSVEVEEYTVKV